MIYGAGGAIGGAVARAFAREGAKVFLAGRPLQSSTQWPRKSPPQGGTAETAQVDAPLIEMSLEDFSRPITIATRTQFLTAKAVVGFVLSLYGAIAAILMDLGPDWYPVALVVGARWQDDEQSAKT